jgi:hypothetical protein
MGYFHRSFVFREVFNLSENCVGRMRSDNPRFEDLKQYPPE